MRGERPVIAVLAFDNRSDDKDAEKFDEFEGSAMSSKKVLVARQVRDERPPARQQFVEHTSKREDVTARIGRLPLEQPGYELMDLWRQVEADLGVQAQRRRPARGRRRSSRPPARRGRSALGARR